MKGSYTRINYGLRPAKHIERKMLCEAFRGLSEFAKIDSYRYVGFGSIYFSDFHLFHKELGITDMISIERSRIDEQRFRFNRPFGCIRIEFGESNDVLPTLHWGVRTILWLDYDGKITKNVLTDISFFCANATPGSMIIVSVNAHYDGSTDDAVGLLKESVSAEKVPSDVDQKSLAAWGTAVVSRRIIDNEIHETLNQRNGLRSSGNKFAYKQLFNFRYSDGAKMTTIGGLIYDEGLSGHVEKCSFSNLPFIRTDADSYLIEVPNLTYREIRHLDRQLPIGDHRQLEASAIPESDLEQYSRIYRYFPLFVESDA